MMCYRDTAYCEDAAICDTPETKCYKKLTKAEGDRAAVMGLPIAWGSFKEYCGKYTEIVGVPV